MRLEGKIAIIIGAGQSPGEGVGNGRATTLRFAQEGARILAVDRDLAAAEATAALARKAGGECVAFEADVTKEATLKAAIDDAHRRWGRIDILHYNVGVSIAGGDASPLDITEEAFDRIYAINLRGAVMAVKHVLPIMRAQRSGHIIQVSSIGGVNAFPTIGLYHASKWALEAFSQSLAAEVATFGIKVTIVEPGGYATDWGGPSAKHATQMPAYDQARGAIAKFRGSNILGDPEATGAAILKIVDATDPPLRIFFGSSGLPVTRAEYARRMQTWEKWNAISLEAQGDLAAKQSR